MFIYGTIKGCSARYCSVICNRIIYNILSDLLSVRFLGLKNVVDPLSTQPSDTVVEFEIPMYPQTVASIDRIARYVGFFYSLNLTAEFTSFLFEILPWDFLALLK